MTDKRPSFQWYPKDYMSDINTISMTPEQEGHYIRLLNLCWMENGLPVKWQEIRALLKGTTDLLESNLQVVLKCFYKRGGKLHHKRLDFEREKQDTYRKRSAEGGRETQRRRKALKGTTDQAQVNVKSSSSSSTAVTTKDVSPKPKDTNKIKSLKEKKELEKKSAIRVLEYFNRLASKDYQKVHMNLTPIRGRLAEFGMTACYRVIENRVSHWKFDPKMNEFLRPTTVFCASKFEGYLNSKDRGKIEKPREKTTTEENIDVIKKWGAKQKAIEENDAGKLHEGDGDI